MPFLSYGIPIYPPPQIGIIKPVEVIIHPAVEVDFLAREAINVRVGKAAALRDQVAEGVVPVARCQGLAAGYRYDPFGNLISKSGSLADANIYRFSSKEIHLNSGMYYYLYRFYDPNLQRWINRDPLGERGCEQLRRRPPSILGDGANPHLFLLGDPVTSIDPWGTQILPGIIRQVAPRLLPKDELGGPYRSHSCTLTGFVRICADIGPNTTVCTYTCVPGGYSDEISFPPTPVTYVTGGGDTCPPQPPNAPYLQGRWIDYIFLYKLDQPGIVGLMAKIDGRAIDHKTLEHFRKLAVKRVIEDGEAPSDVMKSLGLCRTTIYPWLRRYEAKGMEALVARIAQGPEPKLTEKQRQQVKRWILGKDPRQYGFDFGLWSRRIVRELIGAKFGIELGLTAVGRLLASLGITPQKPLRRAYER